MNIRDSDLLGPDEKYTNRINPSEHLSSNTANTVLIEEETAVDRLEFSADSSDKGDKPTPPAPIPMAGKGKTMIFPRKDTIFKKKESLPFDEVSSLVW